MYEQRNFMIFSTSETGSIDFTEVLETSSETLRLNISGSNHLLNGMVIYQHQFLH